MPDDDSPTASYRTTDGDSPFRPGPYAQPPQGQLPPREADKPYLLRKESDEDQRQIDDFASI